MGQPLVAGNWKMHGNLSTNAKLLESVRQALAGVSGARFAVCPPFPYLEQARQALAGSNVAWGAQNVSEHDSGAYTGEVAGAMLSDFGCTYAIVGHSERRALYGERDAQVAAKFQAALRAGLVPILCVGETLAERESGDTEAVVARQLDAVVGAAGAQAVADAVIAYEPVWAIGTGKTATPAQAQSVHEFIRKRLAGHGSALGPKATILYGGSVKASNAVELFGQADVDGGLIGGAALVAEDFVAICKAAANKGR
jgi:triosephosphate isomerase